MPASGLDSHSWLLQAMFEIQKAIGKIDAKTESLSEKIDAVAADVKSQKEKIDKLRLLVAAIGGGFAVIWALAALVPPAIKERLVHLLLG